MSLFRRVSLLSRLQFLLPDRAAGYRMQDYDEQFRLTIAIEDAFAFAMGESDLASEPASDGMRQLAGVLVIHALQYGEHWRIAAEARAFLAWRWPDCPASMPAVPRCSGGCPRPLF